MDSVELVMALEMEFDGEVRDVIQAVPMYCNAI